MAVDFKAAHQRDRKAIQSVASIPGFADHPHSVRVALMTATLEEGQGVQHVFQLIDALGRAVKAEDVRAADRTETTSFENAINARELPYRPEVGEIYVVDKLELVPDTRGLMR
jgi:hypothetical protein